MCKCDFCKESRYNPRTRQLECPHLTCWLSQEDILKILKTVGGVKK